jgi:glycosyltransferase involved in cell wall biosynthesis
MRILSVHNINHIASTYARELTQLGHTVDIYEPNMRGAGARLPIKLSLLPWRVLTMAHATYKFRATYFDLVHIHWASYGIFSIFSEIPVVIHCHGSDVRERLEQPFFRQVLVKAFKQADAVLCITPDLLPVVRSVRPDAYFAPAPLDTTRFVPAWATGGSRARPWTVLLFARLDPQKGSSIALAGIARFVQRHRGICVRLLDWGPLKEQYKQQYEKQYEFVPLVPPEQVQKLITAADVVIGQFSLGALGLSELQAMSCAKPVICSFRYGDAYPQPPPVCQAQTADEVDAQLEYLFQYPERLYRLGQQARKWVITYHSASQLSAELEGLYHNLLTKHNLSDHRRRGRNNGDIWKSQSI